MPEETKAEIDLKEVLTRIRQVNVVFLTGHTLTLFLQTVDVCVDHKPTLETNSSEARIILQGDNRISLLFEM